MPKYPNYQTYNKARRHPSVLDQRYPVPSLSPGEQYYPLNEIIAPHFGTEEEAARFGAAAFCGFLDDTIEVEHCLVIPAIAALRRLPFDVPPEPKQDLFKTATDEGHHAEQSLRYVAALRRHFDFPELGSPEGPLFLRRLAQQHAAEPNPVYRHLITVLNGIVTETRISKELGRFAKNSNLAASVREICHTHAEDEVIHASQFRALGRWLWDAFDEPTRHKAANFLTDSTIARSVPDLHSISAMVHLSTGRSLRDARQLVYTTYDEDTLLSEMQFAAGPTISFLKELDVGNYSPWEEAVQREWARLREELDVARAGFSR